MKLLVQIFLLAVVSYALATESDGTYTDVHHFAPDLQALPGPSTLNPNDPFHFI
jgi:hypothetical protein